MEPKQRTIGRVAIDRAIRFQSAGDQGDAQEPAGLTCPSCGALLCDATRARLFGGMMLRCCACGEATRA